MAEKQIEEAQDFFADDSEVDISTSRFSQITNSIGNASRRFVGMFYSENIDDELQEETSKDSSSKKKDLSKRDTDESEIITTSIRNNILIQQIEVMKVVVADNAPNDEERKRINSMNLKQINDYLRDNQEKASLNAALSKSDIQKQLSAIEVEGYRKLHQDFGKSYKNLNWQVAEGKESRTKEIKGKDGVVLANLTEITHDTKPFTLELSNGEQQEINSYRTVDFPNHLENSNGPLHLSMAVKDSEGRNIAADKAIYFTAHYDTEGKLTEISSPQPIKFAGAGDDAIGYVERDGQIYTLAVTQGKYREMSQEVAKNRGMAFDVSVQVEATAQDQISMQPEHHNKEPQELAQSEAPPTPERKNPPDVQNQGAAPASQPESYSAPLPMPEGDNLNPPNPPARSNIPNAQSSQSPINLEDNPAAKGIQNTQSVENIQTNLLAGFGELVFKGQEHLKQIQEEISKKEPNPSTIATNTESFIKSNENLLGQQDVSKQIKSYVLSLASSNESLDLEKLNQELYNNNSKSAKSPASPPPPIPPRPDNNAQLDPQSPPSNIPEPPPPPPMPPRDNQQNHAASEQLEQGSNSKGKNNEQKGRGSLLEAIRQGRELNKTDGVRDKNKDENDGLKYALNSAMKNRRDKLSDRNDQNNGSDWDDDEKQDKKDKSTKHQDKVKKQSQNPKNKGWTH